MNEKILLYVPTLEGGGAERVFVNLANYFVQQHKEVTIVTAYGNSYDENISKTVRVTKLFNKKPSSYKLINLLLRAMLMPFYLFLILRGMKPYVFITAVLEANIIGGLAHFLTLSRSKFIIRQAGILANETHPGKLSFALKWSFDKSHLIIANSPSTRDSIIKFNPISQNKIEIIGNPIYKEDHKSYSHIDEPYIMTVGRLENQKDHENLLEAFALVLKEKNIQLKIFGTGSLEKSLKLKTTELDIDKNVEFLGFRNDLNKFYAQSKLFVLSSYNEAFGNVLIEAMSYSIPVVSTNCAGPKFIINNSEIGELCEVKNPKALANSILKVLNNPEHYSKETILDRAKDFSIEKIGIEYLETINKT